jgi:hypothetical protein
MPSGKHVLTNAGLRVNGTDLSDHTSSVTLEDTADEVEFTSFGAGYREFGQGLKNANITASVFNDYAASQIDSVLAPLYSSGGTFPVNVVADKAASISGSNPLFSMTCRLYSYSPVAGAVGDANTTDISLNNAGTAGLTRATSGTF